MVIKHIEGSSPHKDVYELYPDQYVSEKEKFQDKWIKTNLDYFSNVAYAQYESQGKEIVKNYRLLKGILTREDFYEDEEVMSFTEVLSRDMELPAHVKHYPILNPPLNTMVGELSRRPDNSHIKAFDDDSQSAELEAKTKMLLDNVMATTKNRMMLQVAQQQGITPEELSASKEDMQQVEEQASKEVSDKMSNYTSTAEKWGNLVLECIKLEQRMKEKSEEAMKDLLVCSRENFMVEEDNSKSGFNVKVLNPKNVWQLSTADKKYTKDSYAVGTIDILELSEILDLHDLTMKEMEALREEGNGEFRESNLFKNVTGTDSVTYDTYDPLIEREKFLAESQLRENNNKLDSFLGISNSVQGFGSKYVVVKGYWKSKKKTGLLTYMDPETGNVEKTLVDETYQKIPEEISIEWGYQNQWWEGIKIGKNVYKCKPYTLLPYPPIIGVVHDSKNTETKSLVDLMKPFQVLYNICMNQLFSLFEKELGNVANISLRRIPRLKDSSEEDAIDQWEMMARERGITFDDDSPENTKVPVSNQTVARAMDLTRTNEIQSRYQTAVALKNECWELVGFNRQRLGSVLATETATGTNAALNQSYAQTEPYFVQHEYLMNDVYQAIVDASQSIESEKPTSTISFINSEGTNAFIQVEGNELKLADLKVFVTSRSEDQRILNELRQLGQPMLQNGGDIYDVAILYSTNSVRQMKDTFKKLKERKQMLEDQQQQNAQQDMEQKQKQFEAMQQQAIADKQQDVANENYQNELDRLNKKEVAIINTFKYQEDNLKDTNANSVPDILEYSKFTQETDAANKKHENDARKIAAEMKKNNDQMQLELRKIALEKQSLSDKKEMQDKQIKADLLLAKYRDKGTYTPSKKSTKNSKK